MAPSSRSVEISQELLDNLLDNSIPEKRLKGSKVRDEDLLMVSFLVIEKTRAVERDDLFRFIPK